MSEYERDGVEDRASFPELGPLDGDVGPALPLTPEALARFADQIERRFAVQQGAPIRWRPRLIGRRFMVAGTLLAASAAAAIYGASALRSERAPERRAERAAPPAAAVPPLVAPVVAVPAVARPEPSEPPTTQDSRPSSSPGLAPPATARPEGRDAPSTLRADEELRAKAGQARSAAADRLAAANGMRSRHRYREAEALYLRVIELYPNSVPASVARVAAAEIRLEQFGDVDGAERLYREAKTKGGELIAEAQFGLAQVFRARSDAAAERRALQEFVAHHPESPLVSAAQRRLQALAVP